MEISEGCGCYSALHKWKSMIDNHPIMQFWLPAISSPPWSNQRSGRKDNSEIYTLAPFLSVLFSLRFWVNPLVGFLPRSLSSSKAFNGVSASMTHHIPNSIFPPAPALAEKASAFSSFQFRWIIYLISPNATFLVNCHSRVRCTSFVISEGAFKAGHNLFRSTTVQWAIDVTDKKEGYCEDTRFWSRLTEEKRKKLDNFVLRSSVWIKIESLLSCYSR